MHIRTASHHSAYIPHLPVSVDTRPYIFMKGGLRPIPHPRQEAMVDRVAINIFDAPCEFDFVADRMLPGPPLP